MEPNPYRPPRIPSDPPDVPPVNSSQGFGWSGNMRVHASIVALAIGVIGVLAFIIAGLFAR